eukprot:CCRYP_016287-RA/>CCRYP_016287-RA protein AED:0.43 eAED:0.44 QI:167/0/0.5/1/1/1/2/0/268
MKFVATRLKRSYVVVITANLLSFSPAAMGKPSLSSNIGYRRVPAFSFPHHFSSVPISPLAGVQTNRISSSVSLHPKSVTKIPSLNRVWSNRRLRLLANAYHLKNGMTSSCLFASVDDDGLTSETESPNAKGSSLRNDIQNIITLIGAQGLLVPFSIVLAKVLELPNRGLGATFSFSTTALVDGLQWTTPLFVLAVYALLAGAASVFFGYLYNTSQNLAVPMVCHAVYDVGALLWAHFSVTALSKEEQQKLLEGGPGAPILSTTNNDLV